MSRERTFECVVRRAQTFAIVRILNDLDDEKAVLKKAGRPLSRRTLENSRSTGMKGTFDYQSPYLSFLPLKFLFNFIDRTNSPFKIIVCDVLLIKKQTIFLKDY